MGLIYYTPEGGRQVKCWDDSTGDKGTSNFRYCSWYDDNGGENGGGNEEDNGGGGLPEIIETVKNPISILAIGIVGIIWFILRR